MTLERRFQAGFEEEATDDPGLVIGQDGVVRVVDQAGTRSEVSDGGLKVAVKTLTNDDVIALPTTAVELVPAPGSGKIVVPIYGFALFKRVADYSNIDPDCHLLIIPTNISFAPDYLAALRESNEDSNVSAFLANGSSEMVIFSPRGDVNQAEFDTSAWAHTTFESIESVDDANLIFAVNNETSGNFEGGDPDNIVAVYVTYFIADIP